MVRDVDAGGVSADGGGGGLLAEFGAWLDRERGMSPVSVRCYCGQAKVFLAAIGGLGAVSRLDAGKVTAFTVDYCRNRNRWSAKAMVTSLRAFPRFAHATGRTGVPLAASVPAVASWRLSALPLGPSAAEIGRLLAGCDRRTTVGLRDYASPDAAGPARAAGRRGRRAPARGHRLAGEITVTGKGSRTERLPLPTAAGEALAAWLTDGPAAVLLAGGVRDGAAALPAVDARGGPCGHGPGLRPGRAPAPGSAPVAPCAGHRVAARGRIAGRGRAGAAAPRPAGHGAPCESRPGRAASFGGPAARERGMSALRTAAQEYPAIRRTLGFKLTTQGGHLAFDEISHSSLMGRVRARIGDRRVLDLVKAFLKSGILGEDGRLRDTTAGTPQGSLCSASHNPPYAQCRVMCSAGP